jgi:hypothetical protein
VAPLVAVSLTLTLAAVAFAATRQTAEQPHRIPRGALRISLGAPVSRPISAGFLGFSIEYSSAIPYLGTDPAQINPTFLQLVRNLDPAQSPVIRFGGDSTDWSWWPVRGVAKPAGVKITLDPQLASVVHAMSVDLGAKLILGIQFEANSRSVAATEASQLRNRIGAGHVDGFELGNEPEVYAALGWYASKTGAPVFGRPPGWDVASWMSDYKSIASALPRGVPLIGPATGAPLFQAAIPTFLTSEPRVKTVTLHRYPLRRCSTPASSPQSPTISHLLERSSSDGLAATVAGTAAVAHAAGDPLRVDELNSVSCGGDLGVSDTFAATLWSLDTLFAMARAGVDGVNVHTFAGAWYEPFGFTETDGTWQAQVKPLYYGMLAFAQAAPPGSRLLPIAQPPIGTLRLWATKATNGTVRVVLINESTSQARTLAVAAPSGTRTATLSSLSAPSLSATGGVTLGGQTFASDTTTGRLAGTPDTPTLPATQGHFVVTVPAASAAIVTIPARS